MPDEHVRRRRARLDARTRAALTAWMKALELDVYTRDDVKMIRAVLKAADAEGQK